MLGAAPVGLGVDSSDKEDSDDVTESWRPTAAAISASELSMDDRFLDERSKDSGKGL